MSDAIGIRLDSESLRKIELISQQETQDRSTTIRKLIELGYRNFIKKKAMEDYVQGKITFSEAAARAELTLWEMEQFLVEQGYKSSYSVEDLEEELRLVSTKK